MAGARAKRRSPLVRHPTLWSMKSTVRVTANDRGAMWDGAYQELDDRDGRDCGLILEFMADIHQRRWTVAVKADGELGIRRIKEVSLAGNPPSSSAKWHRARWTTRTGRVWSADVTGLPPAEAVAVGESAAEWMESLSKSYSD